MNTTLVVVRAFGSHAKGDVITDAAAIAIILASEQVQNVVRVLTPAPVASGPVNSAAGS